MFSCKHYRTHTDKTFCFLLHKHEEQNAVSSSLPTQNLLRLLTIQTMEFDLNV